MGRHPFVQGITSSHAMGGTVGRHLARALGPGAPVIDELLAVAWTAFR